MKLNIQYYITVNIICFAFGQIQQLIKNFSGALGWGFVVITAGFFFYMGGYFVDEGCFLNKKWKVAFVVLLPVVFFLDILLIRIVPWYNDSAATAYYVLYTLGYLFKRLPKINLNNVSYISPANDFISMGFANISGDDKHVFIGDQIWTLENLNSTRFINGDIITEARTINEWNKAAQNSEPAWCHYDNNPENGSIYGKLYNWFAVNDPRGLANEGWRIPSYEDWFQLIYYLGGPGSAGKFLKSPTGWIKHGNGTNDSDFYAQAGGIRHSEGLFYDIGKKGWWWSSTEISTKTAKSIILRYDGNYVDNHKSQKSNGFSIRCVKKLE